MPQEFRLHPFRRRPRRHHANSVYGPNQRRELFESLGEIGITPVFFDTVYFSDQEGTTVEATGTMWAFAKSRIRKSASY